MQMMHPLASSKRLLLVLVLLLYVPFAARTARDALHATADFASFYMGARVAFVEQRSPFTPDAFAHGEAVTGHAVYPYLYPPPSLLAFYPLAHLSYAGGKALMLVANHACLLLFAYVLVCGILRLHLQQSGGLLLVAAAAVYLLAYQPLRFEFYHGQIDLLVLSCLCLSWLALKSQRPPLYSALPLAVAIVLKTYPLAFLPLLVVRRNYRALFYVVGLLILCTAVAYWVLPPAVWSDYARNVLPTGGYGRSPYNLGSPAFPWNQSINGFTARLFAPNEFTEPLLASTSLARTVPYALALAVIAATLLASYLANRRGEPRRTLDAEFASCLLMMFMVSPVAWEQHLVFALPAALMALRRCSRSDVDPLHAALLAAGLLVLAWPLPIDSQLLRRGALTLLISVKLYAVAAMWAVLIWRIVTADRERLI